MFDIPVYLLLNSQTVQSIVKKDLPLDILYTKLYKDSHRLSKVEPERLDRKKRDENHRLTCLKEIIEERKKRKASEEEKLTGTPVSIEEITDEQVAGPITPEETVWAQQRFQHLIAQSQGVSAARMSAQHVSSAVFNESQDAPSTVS